MTTPGGSAPDGAYVVGSRYGQDETSATVNAKIRGQTLGGFQTAQTGFKGWIGGLFSGFANLAEGIGDVVGNIVGAITGGRFFSLGGLSTWGGEVTNEIQTISDGQIAANNRLVKLEEITGTGVTTPIWSSAGGKDLVSFPRAMMQVHNYKDSDESSSNNQRTTDIPAFSQGHQFIDMAFIRGGVDRKVIPKVVKIITGADQSWFDINAWYVGIYVYRHSDRSMVKVWDSGNIASVLSGQRQAYNIGTGLTNTYIEPDHLVAIASLQLAPGIGQKPRGLGCIFQTGISEAFGTIPTGPHAYVGGKNSLWDVLPMSSLTFPKNKIMWAAVGEST